MLNKLRFIMITCFSFFLASSASAAMITNWDYEIEGIFVNYTSSAGGSNGIAGSLPQTLSWNYDSGIASSGSATGVTKISWGTGTNGPSSLQINDKSGVVETNDVNPVYGLEFLHSNQPITSTSPTLTSGSVRAVIKITPQDVLGALGPFSTILTFTFVETSNSFNPSTNPLNSDVFQLTSVANTIEDFLVYENYVYTLDFNSNLPTIPAGYPGAGNFGWTTVETQTTSIQTLFSIKAREIPSAVPEPSTVLLLGAGLLGLGAVARRRRAN